MLQIPPPENLAGLLLLIAALLYLRRMAHYAVGLGRLRRHEAGPLGQMDFAARPRVSVLVAARNESENIPFLLDALLAQTYPAEQFEVVLMDDRSTDRTPEIVSLLQARWGARLKYLRILEVPDGWTGKKWALQTAAKQATGTILVTTDADCRPAPTWLGAVAAAMEGGEGYDLMAGPVDYESAGPWPWPERLLRTEFFVLSLVGAGAIADGKPLIVSGQNLAYRRALHDRVGGASKHADIPSGDDVFLLYQAHAHDARIGYLLDERALVHTRPPAGLKAFFRQRARWTSKGTRFPTHPLYFSLLTWGLNAGFLVAVEAALLGTTALWPFLAGALVAKGAGDLSVLREARHYGHPAPVFDYLTAWPLHMVYVTAAGLAGLLGGVRDWT